MDNVGLKEMEIMLQKSQQEQRKHMNLGRLVVESKIGENFGNNKNNKTRGLFHNANLS